MRTYYPDTTQLKDRIVEFASKYPQNDKEENVLQIYSIHAIKEYAIADESMFLHLLEIAERYKELPDLFEAHQANATAWESLADLIGVKVSGKENIELTWNIHSDASEKIRERIRQAILVHGFCTV